MKKSLIALAVASVFIAPAALAQVSIYGKAHVSLDMEDTGANTAETKRTRVNSAGSRLGFKGSEKLSDDLSAVFGIETAISFDSPNQAVGGAQSTGLTTGSGGTTLGDRGIFLGLASKTAGTAMLGHGGTPMKGATRGLDLFDGTPGKNDGLMQGAAFGAGNDWNKNGGNGLTYVSPNMNGVTVTLGKGFTESAASTVGSGAVHLLAQYNAGPVYGFITQSTNSSGTVAEAKTVSYGGSYSMGAFALNAIFEKSENTASSALITEWTGTYFGGKYNISKTDAVKLAVTNISNSKIGTVTTPDGDRQAVVGYDHNLSKDTKVYALYSRLTPSVASGVAKVTSTIASVGLQKNF